MKMAVWGLLWLSVCLVTATGQSLTIDHSIADTEQSKIQNITEDQDRNSNNGANQFFDTSLAVNNSAELDSKSNSENIQEEQIDESSRSRESQSHEPSSTETENPSTEMSTTTGNISDENLSGTTTSEEAVPETSDRPESQELSAEIHSVENSSAESASNQPPASVSSEADSGANSNEDANVSNGDENKQIVQTTHGPVTGHKWSETEIFAFIDIPYGKIDRPFEAPRTAQSWIEETHQVTDHNSRCPQMQGDHYVGDLNCLTLSIFAPINAENASVFFYIHDSSFHSGDPMIYGPEHVVSKGVILILPNYRIGALGFLCLQNETAPGNAGLKDLAEALEWTKNNIDRFGGNSSNIVVGGDGDAGALAGFLALSSPSKSYISKVISESGSMLSHLALDRNPITKATKLAENIRNNQTDGAIYNNTFTEVTTQTIVEAARGMRFNPCVEHDREPFIDVPPWKLLQNKEIDITFMIGSASHAGTHEAVATTDTFIEQLNTDIGLVLPQDLVFKGDDEKAENALRVKTQYFGNGTISRSHMEQLSLWSTDASYLGPLIRFARPLVDAGATVYLFEFDFVGDLNRELISMERPVAGAVRSDIIGYLFTQSGYVPGDGTPEKHVIDLVVKLWVSFINTGIPTAENLVWEKFKSEVESEEQYLQINSQPRLVKGLHVDRLRLWSELYSEYFIDRSFALKLTPGVANLYVTLLIWIANTKLDYN